MSPELSFYRAMHYSAQRGISIVILSVCYIRDPLSENNKTTN